MNKRLSWALSTVIGVLAAGLGVAAPAQAMVRATPDTVRTAVGSFWAQFGSGRPFFICSGTFVSETVFVTASHCVDYIVRYGGNASVSLADAFPADGSPPADLVPAEAHLNPRYKESNGTDLYQFDVSVLTVAAMPQHEGQVTPASLPGARLLDGLKASGGLRGAVFTVAGYGTESMVVDPVGPGTSPTSFPDTGLRQSGLLGFGALGASVLHENQRANAGYAGAGYGDSGGPSFLGTSNTIVGVTSTGDIPCYATNTAYRLDTAEARDFLGQFVALPQ